MTPEMKPEDGTSGLLATVPLGGLLACVLRLAVPADRREEFLGDLIEEAILRRNRATPDNQAIWLWTQVLRSLPTLLGLRLRGLVMSGWASPTPARPGGGLLVAARGSHRGLPLSLAASVSAHGLVVVAALGWLFARVEEVQPLDALDEAIVAAASIAESEPEPETSGAAETSMRREQPSPARRSRAGRRSPPVSSRPAAAPEPGRDLPGRASPTATATELIEQPPAVAIGRGTGTGPVALPPRIAEKRCLTCPTPQLPPAYAHLARGQDMVVHTCVNSAGEVTSVNVLRGFDTTVNREVTATVRHWRLAPYQLNGHPVPFCYATRFIFASS
jgi:hypothetical protein